MEEQKIVYKDIDELMLCNENPRIGYAFDEIDAIHKIIAEQGEKIIELMKSLIEEGWLVGELPGLFFDGNHYVVYEGNRRISALKCFFNIDLLPHKSKTSDKIKKYVSNFSNEEIKELRKNFTRIPCVIYNKKEDAYRYMEKRHTPNNGKGDTLEKWNTLSNELFKNNVIGKKTLFGAIYSDYYDLFMDKENFPATTLTRILNNSYAKEKLGLNFNNNILSLEDKKKFREYLKKIIKDIEIKKINSRILSKATDIQKYIEQIIGIDRDNLNIQVKIKENERLKEQNLTEQGENNVKLEDNKNVSLNKKEQSITKITTAIEGKKATQIKLPSGIRFDYLEIKNVDNKNVENYGILYIAYELKEISKTGDYKKYPSATAMLIRNLLEQSLKYQLKKEGEWKICVDNYRRKNQTDKEPGLEYIIKHCLGNITRIFPNNRDIQRLFMSFAQNQGTKDYLDIIVHHPELTVSQYEVLEKIVENSLYNIIYYIFNN